MARFAGSKMISLLALVISVASCAGWWQRHTEEFHKACDCPPNDPDLISCTCNDARTPDCYPPLTDNGDPVAWNMARPPTPDQLAALKRYEARKRGLLPCWKTTGIACYDHDGDTFDAPTTTTEGTSQ